MTGSYAYLYTTDPDLLITLTLQCVDLEFSNEWSPTLNGGKLPIFPKMKRRFSHEIISRSKVEYCKQTAEM